MNDIGMVAVNESFDLNLAIWDAATDSPVGSDILGNRTWECELNSIPTSETLVGDSSKRIEIGN